MFGGFVLLSGGGTWQWQCGTDRWVSGLTGNVMHPPCLLLLRGGLGRAPIPTLTPASIDKLKNFTTLLNIIL